MRFTLCLVFVTASVAASCRPPGTTSSPTNGAAQLGEPQRARDAGTPFASVDVVANADATAREPNADERDLIANPATNWSDPRLVALLAADCEAVHPNATEESTESEDPDSGYTPVRPVEHPFWPLSCFAGIAEQSCSYDPCIRGERDPCEIECGRACVPCETACRASCAQCREPCRDDACRLRCATSCASCLDQCVAVRDRCATGECARRHAACTAAKVIQWRRTCQRSCRACTQRCGDEGECVRTCLTGRQHRGCNEEQRSICAWHGPRWGDPDFE